MSIYIDDNSVTLLLDTAILPSINNKFYTTRKGMLKRNHYFTKGQQALHKTVTLLTQKNEKELFERCPFLRAGDMLQVDILYLTPSVNKADIDNKQKSIQDVLQSSTLIGNDVRIFKTTTEKGYSDTECMFIKITKYVE